MNNIELPKDEDGKECYKCRDIYDEHGDLEMAEHDHNYCHGWAHCGNECCGECMVCGQ